MAHDDETPLLLLMDAHSELHLPSVSGEA